MRMQNGTAALEDRLAVSYKTKQTNTIRPTVALLDTYPGNKENLRPHKSLYTNVHNSSIPNSQKCKQPQCLLMGK